MKCAICFFSTRHQKDLKMQTFGVGRFEDKLRSYKNKFISEYNGITSSDLCNCQKYSTNESYIKYINDFTSDLKAYSTTVGSVFDKLIEIYIDFCSQQNHMAIDKMNGFFEKFKIHYNTTSVFDYSGILYRGRENNFTPSSEKDFFHIPFSQRKLVSNQRFSISGHPMLYFGKSPYCVSKELKLEINEMHMAGFVPKYDYYFNKKILSIENYMTSLLENSLPGLFAGGVGVVYGSPGYSPSPNDIENKIAATIFNEICTFPVESYGTFIEEYVIPQLTTTFLKEKNFIGFSFPSTKNYDELVNTHRFTKNDHNIALFVDYDPNNDYNENLLNTFEYIDCDLNSPSDTYLEINKIKKAFTSKVKNLSTKGNNNNSYIIPVTMAMLQLEYIENANLYGSPYFESKFGKTELDAVKKLIKMMELKIV